MQTKPPENIKTFASESELDCDWLRSYPTELIEALARMARECGVRVYIAGGAVRDWLNGKDAADLDLTVSGDGLVCGAFLARSLAATLVVLDADAGAVRVAWRIPLDISGYREGTDSIEADLGRRDFSVNAMAVFFDPEQKKICSCRHLIDPVGGLADLKAGIIRATAPQVFSSDPLRLLRAYRFVAVLGFSLEQETLGLIRAHASLLKRVAAERIAYELGLIMASSKSSKVFADMAEIGLLWEILPELKLTVGQLQPSSHHLDVFGHCLATLHCMEKLLLDPAPWFPEQALELRQYLAEGRHRVRLKWAAFLHDLGKPLVAARHGGQLTFYDHDRIGAEQFSAIARRLRWSKADLQAVSGLIAMHMHPFHLNNCRQQGGITARACLRLAKKSGPDLPGLFLLAMADSLAAAGVRKPPDMENGLAQLYSQVSRIYRESIKPVLEAPRLLDGQVLQQLFKLEPGPVFREILSGLEEAQVAGEVTDREQAEAWVRSFLFKSPFL